MIKVLLGALVGVIAATVGKEIFRRLQSTLSTKRMTAGLQKEYFVDTLILQVKLDDSDIIQAIDFSKYESDKFVWLTLNFSEKYFEDFLMRNGLEVCGDEDSIFVEFYNVKLFWNIGGGVVHWDWECLDE